MPCPFPRGELVRDTCCGQVFGRASGRRGERRQGKVEGSRGDATVAFSQLIFKFSLLSTFNAFYYTMFCSGITEHQLVVILTLVKTLREREESFGFWPIRASIEARKKADGHNIEQRKKMLALAHRQIDSVCLIKNLGLQSDFKAQPRLKFIAFLSSKLNLLQLRVVLKQFLPSVPA